MQSAPSRVKLPKDCLALAGNCAGSFQELPPGSVFLPGGTIVASGFDGDVIVHYVDQIIVLGLLSLYHFCLIASWSCLVYVSASHRSERVLFIPPILKASAAFLDTWGLVEELPLPTVLESEVGRWHERFSADLVNVVRIKQNTAGSSFRPKQRTWLDSLLRYTAVLSN